jgi:hypothetical protein
MDTKKITESESVTIEMVNKSPTKALIMLSAGAMAPDKFNEGQQRFQCLAEIDGQQKLWRPNKTTLRNLQAKYGTESENWVGKKISLSIGSVEGKITVIGTV